VVPDYRHDAIRELIVGDYRCIYQIVGDEVRILTVMYGSRELMRHLPDGPWDIERDFDRMHQATISFGSSRVRLRAFSGAAGGRRRLVRDSVSATARAHWTHQIGGIFLPLNVAKVEGATHTSAAH